MATVRGSKTEDDSVEKMDRRIGRDGAKSQGVNTEGKVRELTVTTQPLRQGKGSATTRR
ncbi:hypothetical protein A4X13_0g9269, partial [Tilletia indica]